jgi:hypothetical protein
MPLLALLGLGAWSCGGSGVSPPDCGTAAPSAPAQLRPSPISHDFGAVAVGELGDVASFTLENAGGGVSGPPMATVVGADFKLTHDCVNALAPGSHCNLSVIFQPSALGDRIGRLEVVASPGGKVVVSLAGLGVEGERLALAPALHDFGMLAIGSTSDAVTWTVTNTGTAAVDGRLVVRLDGPEFVSTATDAGCVAITGLARGASCSIDVRFKPLTPGARLGTLSVSHGTLMASATLTGMAVVPATLAMSPASYSVSVVAGQESPPLAFVVANLGDLSTGPLAVGLLGTDAGSFRITDQSCQAPLGPAGACQFAVVLAATTAGPRTVTVAVTSPAGGSAQATISADVTSPDAGAREAGAP